MEADHSAELDVQENTKAQGLASEKVSFSLRWLTSDTFEIFLLRTKLFTEFYKFEHSCL